MRAAEIILGYSCNLNCRFCMGEQDMRNRDHPFSMVRSTLIGLRSEGYESICFSGGEPTIRRSLMDMVRLARYLGFIRIKVQTNALMLSMEKYLKGLLDSGVNAIGVTVPSMDKTLYDSIVRQEGAHDLLGRALMNLQDAHQRTGNGLEIEFDIVLTKDSMTTLKQDIRTLQRYSDKINIKFPGLAGNAACYSIAPEMGYACHKIEEAIKDASAQFIIQYVPFCLIPGHEDKMLDLQKTSLLICEGENRFDFSEAFAHTHMKPDGCKGCRFESSCPGIDRNYLQKYGMPEIRRR